MKARGFRSNAASLKKFPVPFILHWKENHFVVLEKIKNDTYYIVDPEVGKRKMPIKEFEQFYSGAALTFETTDSFQERKRENDSGFFLQVIKRYKARIFTLIVISLLLQLTAIGIPLLTKWVTDEVLLVGEKSLLTVLGYSLISIFILYVFLTSIRGVVITKLQTKMDSYMMSTFIERLFRLPYLFFENRSSGELLFRSNLMIHIRQILSGNSVRFFIDILLIITYLVIMFIYSLPLALIVVAIGILIMMIVIFNTRVLKNLSDQMVTAQGEVQKYLSEHIYGISDVKMLGHEDVVYQTWKEKYDAQLRVTEKSGIWSSYIQAISTSIHFIIPLFLLWAGGYFVLNNSITLGTLIAFISMAAAFITPIISLSSGYMDLIYLSSYVQRLMDVIKSKPEQEKKEDLVQRELEGNITLQDVSFSYDSFSEPVLKNISFTVERGEKVAIVGPSGSGKSTLVKVLVGLYKPTGGSVLYDDINLENYHLQSLRTQIGVVLQEARLFNRTVLENITMGGKEHAAHAEEAIGQAYADEFIKDLPSGLDTNISEGGVNFSGGQRQRLILARALISQPKILVLDEATSALDNHAEKMIDEEISELSSTRIIIAHRLSTIKNADRIIVLENGRLSETGNPC